VVKVVERGRFRVYVYSEQGQRHHRPHCHVYWDGTSSVVGLVDYAVLRGAPLPRRARQLVEDHFHDLWRVWSDLNEERDE